MIKAALVFPRFKYPSGDPPLGISYIHSYIKRKTGLDMDIYDTTFEKNPIEHLKNSFKNNKYDLIGISLMTSMLKDALNVAKIIKEINPSTKIIFGGPHPTVMPYETLMNKYVDAVIIGEGELTFLDLINNNGNFSDIKGIWYKKNNKIIKNNPRLPLKNLDELGFPLLEKLPMEKYIKVWFQLELSIGKKRGSNIIMSRGCPYNCSYCQPTLKTLFGNYVRSRSAKSVIEELKYLKKKFDINSFFFQDDTFAFNKKNIFELCDLMIKEKLNLIWGCNIRVDLVEEDLLKKMKEAGLKKLAVGIESASQRILDTIYNKGITIKQVERAVDIISKLGLECRGYFMIGAPTETVEEIEETIKFAKKLKINEATFSITTPLPHTNLYENTKNMIDREISDFDYYKTPVYKGDNILSPKKLKWLKRKALLEFYLSPRIIKRTLKSCFYPPELKTTLYKLKRF
ncbi:MAG: radical SAM protein [archaeon]